VAGDPGFTDSDYRFNVEYYGDVLKGTPTQGQQFFEAVTTLDVNDGRLTIRNDSFAVNNKPIGLYGFVSDNGLAHGSRGNGFTYGWNVDLVILSGIPTGYGFTHGSGVVAVTDGRLTVRSAPGAANNKLNTLRILQQ
jgi:hypothetical protein